MKFKFVLNNPYPTYYTNSVGQTMFTRGGYSSRDDKIDVYLESFGEMYKSCDEDELIEEICKTIVHEVLHWQIKQHCKMEKIAKFIVGEEELVRMVVDWGKVFK